VQPALAKCLQTMKKNTTIAAVLVVAAVFLFFLVLTKIANEAPPQPPNGYTFWLYAQHVVECSPTEITLVGNHQVETHLEIDNSWPQCSTFHKGDVLDFYLSRGERTHFLREEPTAWWRKSM
jgi:hypothetical protein